MFIYQGSSRESLSEVSPGGAGGAKDQVRWARRLAGLCGGGFLSTFLVLETSWDL